ncbi:MAG: hypothetical protein E7490_00165 [Ruminococcaceae bacterium]|nr:hypothetical protein [Oscillospiraceae bacterium]
MKKRRCPHCGEECFGFFRRSFPLFRYNKLTGETKIGSYCPQCNNLAISCRRKNLNKHSVIPQHILNIAVMFVVFFIQTILTAGFITSGNSKMEAPLIILSIIIFLTILFISRLFFPALVKIDRSYNSYVIPSADKDISIVLDSPCKRIKYLSIYGIRFNEKVKSIKFSEAFTNGLVPVVFLNEEGTEEYPIHIIKGEFIPRELLKDNSRFEIVDNGKVIATGVLEIKTEK